MLDPFLNSNTISNNTNVYVFLLTDKKKEGNYSVENEDEIIEIFKVYGFNIGFVKYMEDYDSVEEDIVHENFINNVKHTAAHNTKEPQQYGLLPTDVAPYKLFSQIAEIKPPSKN
jgi:hypothetical protein